MTESDAHNQQHWDRQGWVREMVRQHQSPLIRYARSIVKDEHAARDIVQETFLSLCKQAPGDLAGHEVAWLFRVCHNNALNRLRKERRMSHNSEHMGALESPENATKAVENAQDNKAVVRLIDQLPSNQQKVIRLRFHSGLAYREISEATGLTVSNVGYLLHTALGKLRQQMQQLDA
ncbi:RNA polymerase sigma factor [Roseiconus lacunae]|uniref:RNA polymerase sigma factor n=1 Tax=Roseiconus lacunae TaxID=2605694 RepID=UPI0011F3EB6D|nr:sigma-70 family RNA polymerase sigma factor [Roseiconus lacunae]